MAISDQEHIKNLNRLEQDNMLYDVIINDIPIWRLLRFNYRLSYLKKTSGFINKTTRRDISILTIGKGLLSSIYDVFKIMLSRKHNTTLFLSFPRLGLENGNYYDKFVDPIIDQVTFPGDTLIFQSSLGGKYATPRAHDNLTSKTDSIRYVSNFIGILFSPIIYLSYHSKINILRNSVRKVYTVGGFFNIKTAITLGSFIVSKNIYKFIFKRLNVKRIFLVSRPIFIPQIVGAYTLDIPVYELQHGATIAETALYTGPYHKIVDTDFFLTFGNIWIGEQFGVPVSKIINIGWAHRANQLTSNEVKTNPNRLLFISSPAITDKIISVITSLHQVNQHYAFVIRLHPQEALNANQQGLVDNIPNLTVEYYTKNIVTSILSSKAIIGDNSTVLYEALSLGKPVRQLNFGPFQRDYTVLETTLFKPISSVKCFFNFLEDKDDLVSHNNDIYSSFDTYLMNDILKI